jgi:putative MATE family efflux protein
VAGDRLTVRRVLALAAPALGVLAAEPLYVLVDTAVVGHLGAVPLAGLSLGGTLFSLVSSQLTFLTYGTTARTARLHGAGRGRDAVQEGVQATWLGIAVGVALSLIALLCVGPLTRGLVGQGPIADASARWLRIALIGAPMVLVSMAGNGWMRGVQENVRPLRYVLSGNVLSAVLCVLFVFGFRWGLDGSALANLIGQVVGGGLFLRALVVERVSLKPDLARIRAQFGVSRDLVLRSLAFQACFVSATSVAARIGAQAAAANQIVWQLWTFLTLVLDSLAVAAQETVGEALGAGSARRARVIANQITLYSFGFGALLAVLFAALYPVLPSLFTSDAGVLRVVPSVWWFFVAVQPIGGVVFALDGVFLGAGDAAYLRTTTMASALLGYLPMIWLSWSFGWGLPGIWTGLTVLMLARLATLLPRMWSRRWLVVGPGAEFDRGPLSTADEYQGG